MHILMKTKVLMRISDPWELGESLDWRAFEARIIAINNNELLIQLLSPFVYKRIVCEYFIAAPRYESDQLDKLLRHESLACGMTLVSANQANSKSPFDLTKWRGGIAIIGVLDPILS